jgi:hypothetical protein
MPWSEAVALLEREPDKIFAVVRHPADRLRSEFRYQKDMGHFKWLNRRLGWMSFATWLRVMSLTSRLLPHVHDNHFRPQNDLMPESGVDIFRLEDGLDAVAQYLSKISGDAVAPMPHSLSSKKGEKVCLSRHDLRFITRMYKKDFIRFGYKLPDRVALNKAPHDPWAWLRLGFALLAAPLVAYQYSRGRL